MPTTNQSPTTAARNAPPSRWRIAIRVVALWLASHVVMIAGHVLLVFLYSVAIEPGLENADYRQFAERSAPWFSIVFGAPVFYAVGMLLRRRVQPHARGAGLTVWGLYTATDAAILLASVGSPPPLLAGQWLVSQAVKLLVVLWATRRLAGG